MSSLKKDLRSSHFNLGHNPVDYTSSAKSTLVQYDVKIPTSQEKALAASNVAKVNFHIGDDKKRDLKNIQSTYKEAVSNLNGNNPS